jgi:hypothetical protein
MRTNILKSIFFFTVLFLGSCNPDLRMPAVTKVTFPLITFDPTSAKLILDGVYSGKFIVDTYYKDLPVNSRIVIARNGDYTNVKTFKTDITTFPITEPITNTDLTTLFGIAAIATPDYFEIGLDVMMQDGKWYPAFNPNGVAYGSGLFSLAGAAPILKIKTACALNLDAFVGPVTVNDPDFYGGTYAATIQKIDATHLKLVSFATSAGSIILTIDPSSLSVTVAKQVYAANAGFLDPSYAVYTNVAAVSISQGEINACTHVIKVTLDNTVDQGDFGNSNITITR